MLSFWLGFGRQLGLCVCSVHCVTDNFGAACWGRPGSGGARAVKVPVGRAIGGDALRPRLGEDSRPMSHIGWMFKGD